MKSIMNASRVMTLVVFSVDVMKVREGRDGDCISSFVKLSQSLPAEKTVRTKGRTATLNQACPAWNMGARYCRVHVEYEYGVVFRYVGRVRYVVIS